MLSDIWFCVKFFFLECNELLVSYMSYLFPNLNHLKTLTLVLIVEMLQNVGVRLCSEIFLWRLILPFVTLKHVCWSHFA